MVGQQLPIFVPIRAIDQITGVLGKVDSKFARIGRTLSRVGRGATAGLTLPLVAFGVSAANTAVSFDRGMNRVQALTGSTAEEVAVLRREAERLGGTTEFAAREVAGGMGFLAQSGQDVGKIFKSIEPTLLLASAAQLDLATTADVATNTLLGYGFQVEQLGMVTDVLAEATTKGNTDLQQLTDAMTLAGPVASTMGQKFSTTVTVLDKLADVNFKAQLGGNALKRALVELIKPTPAAKKALTDLGITASTLFDDQGNLIDFIDLLELLQVRGASPAQIVDIFNKRTAVPMLTLVRQSIPEMRKLADTLENSTGRALEIQQTQLQGTVGQLVEFRSKWEALQITIAESGLLEALGQGAEFIGMLFDKIRAVNPKILKMGLVLGTVVAVVGPLLIVLGGAITVAAGLAAALGLPIAAVLALGAGIAGLIAGGVALILNWEDVKKQGRDVWGAIKFGAGEALDFIATKIAEVKQLVPAWLVDLFMFTNPATAPIAALGALGTAQGGEDEFARQRRIFAEAQAAKRDRAEVRVMLENLPKGTRVEQSGQLGAGVEIEAGFAMGTGA